MVKARPLDRAGIVIILIAVMLFAIRGVTGWQMLYDDPRFNPEKLSIWEFWLESTDNEIIVVLPIAEASLIVSMLLWPLLTRETQSVRRSETVTAWSSVNLNAFEGRNPLPLEKSLF